MKILGTTEYHTCDHCGKVGLKKTIAVEFSNGDVVRFGTTCVRQAWKCEPEESKRIKKISVDAYQRIEQAKSACGTFKAFCDEMRRQGYGARVLTPLNSDAIELTWCWQSVKIAFSEFGC